MPPEDLLDDLCVGGWALRCWALPEDRESDCLVGAVSAAPLPNFEAEEAVCVVRDDGRLRGRVGDLGFGLTKLVFAGGRLTGAGFFPAVTLALDATAVAFFVIVSGPLDDDVLAELLGATVFFSAAVPAGFAGSLGGFFVVVAGFVTGRVVVVEGALGLTTGLVDVAFVLGAGVDEAEDEDADDVFSLCPLPLDVVFFWAASTAALSVGKPGFSLVKGSSSSVILSGFGLGASLVERALSDSALSDASLCLLLVGGGDCLGVVGAEVTASKD